MNVYKGRGRKEGRGDQSPWREYKKGKVRTHGRVLTILHASRLVNKMSLRGKVER